jgi:hypothetical protein
MTSWVKTSPRPFMMLQLPNRPCRDQEQQQLHAIATYIGSRSFCRRPAFIPSCVETRGYHSKSHLQFLNYWGEVQNAVRLTKCFFWAAASRQLSVIQSGTCAPPMWYRSSKVLLEYPVESHGVALQTTQLCSLVPLSFMLLNDCGTAFWLRKSCLILMHWG